MHWSKRRKNLCRRRRTRRQKEEDVQAGVRKGRRRRRRIPTLLLILAVITAVVASGMPAMTEAAKGSVCGSSRAFPNHRQPRMGGGHHRARLIHGELASLGAWPWQVSLHLDLGDVGPIGHWCGGVLVDPVWVITAAHCVKNSLIENHGGGKFTALLSSGSRLLDDGGGGGDEEGGGEGIALPVEDVVVHPEFEEYHNDIALLRLPRDPLVSLLSPVCLPPPEWEEDFLGIRCYATGWGQKSFGGPLQDDLHQVELTVVENTHCEVMYGLKYGIPIRGYHLCAGPILKGGKGTCVGDSGGPLHCNMRDGLWYLAGVTSFGSGCAKPGFPDVFTRTTSHLKWIRETMERYKEGNATLSHQRPK